MWEQDFNAAGVGGRPDPLVWSYEQGDDGWGNGELEMYCAFGSTEKGCDPALPNAFVGHDGYLHIVARKTPDGRYTSARLLSRGLKEFKYGRIEARIRVPAGAGMWPAFWLLGGDSETTHWPACGEIDVMEQLGREPSVVHGTIHGSGPGFKSPGLGKSLELPRQPAFAAGFHTFGVLWREGYVAFYVDDPKKPFAEYRPEDLPPGAVWPFDKRPFYLLLNLAVGGGWPGAPDIATQFPAEMLVDYVKVWELK